MLAAVGPSPMAWICWPFFVPGIPRTDIMPRMDWMARLEWSRLPGLFGTSGWQQPVWNQVVI